MSVKAELKKDIIFWYLILMPVTICLIMIIFYNHPEFGFNSQGYGLGTALTVAFPALWLIIYAFCKYISKQNEKIQQYKNLVENPEEEVK